MSFKLDKLSTRVTKIQSDTQLRFSDLESGSTTKPKKIQSNLPGTSKPQDFGANPGYQMSNLPKQQTINSVESTQTVITQEPEKKDSLLPDKPSEEQYEFAVSFMKIGDYETAEFALKEFIEKNKDHDLAGRLNIGMEKLLELDNYILMQPRHIWMAIKIIPKVKKP